MTNKEKFKEVFEKTFGFIPENNFPCPEKCPREFQDGFCDGCCYYKDFEFEEYKKPESDAKKDYVELRIEVAKIAIDLGKVLADYSPIPSNIIVAFICIFLDTLTGDDLPLEFDLLCTRSDMADKIYKEWPHSFEEYKKPESDVKKDCVELRIEVAKIANDLGKVLADYSPIPSNIIVAFICIFLDTLTGDDLPLEFDLLCTRSDMAEKIYKEWPHSIEYYKKGEKKA